MHECQHRVPAASGQMIPRLVEGLQCRKHPITMIPRAMRAARMSGMMLCMTLLFLHEASKSSNARYDRISAQKDSEFNQILAAL